MIENDKKMTKYQLMINRGSVLLLALTTILMATKYQNTQEKDNNATKEIEFYQK